MATVQWSEHAVNCLREQARYIAEESASSEIAWKWVEDILASTQRLADFPDMGHAVPEFPTGPYREIRVRKYFRLIYRHVDGICFILTVRRGSMLLDETLFPDFP